MSESFVVKTSDFVNVSVTTPQDNAVCVLEKRFNKSLSIADTKVGTFEVLYYFTGIELKAAATEWMSTMQSYNSNKHLGIS